MAGAAFGGFATLGSQERRRTETRRFLVINALRLGFWTHPGVYVKLFAEQVSASHMFCDSHFDPVLVLCRAEKVCGAMAQLMHTVLLYRANALSTVQ